jgi:hypothetical protein
VPAVALVVVAVPTVVDSMASLWARQTSAQAAQWLDGTPGAVVTDVDWHGTTVVVSVLGPAELPPLDELGAAVDAVLLRDPTPQLVHTVGADIERVDPE